MFIGMRCFILDGRNFFGKVTTKASLRLQIKAKSTEIITTLANLRWSGPCALFIYRKRARKRVFIGLKICVVILKNFIPLYFASLTSTSAKSMSWSYKYDYNVILKRAWKLNMLIESYRRKVPKAHINFICIFLQNSREF